MTTQEEIDLIDTVIEQIRFNLDHLTPRQVSDYTVKLSGWYYRLSTLSADATREFYRTWDELRCTAESKASAEITAKASNEYHLKIAIELKFEALKEMIMALKKRLDMLENETKGKY